jgi:hypothetical protein
MIYDKYIPDIYHLLGPDPNQRVTDWISTGGRRIRSFYRPVPLLYFQRHFSSPIVHHPCTTLDVASLQIVAGLWQDFLKLN